MKNLFKKSLLSVVCTLSVLFCARQAEAMPKTISINIPGDPYNGTYDIAPEHVQDFMKKCFETMFRIAEKEACETVAKACRKYFNSLGEKKLFLYGVYQERRPSLFRKKAKGLARANVAYFPYMSFHEKIKKLQSSQKGTICHEVAHLFLGHHESNKTTNQKEFEAEDLTIRTLFEMDLKEEVKRRADDWFPVNSEKIYPYFFGYCNGFAKVKKMRNKEKENSSHVSLLDKIPCIAPLAIGASLLGLACTKILKTKSKKNIAAFCGIIGLGFSFYLWKKHSKEPINQPVKKKKKGKTTKQLIQIIENWEPKTVQEAHEWYKKNKSMFSDQIKWKF